MSINLHILTRELTPFEHLVCEHLCEGLTNSAIARETAHTEKVVENTVSRVAHAFGIKADGERNVRVMLALAYRSQFGDKAFEKMGLPCRHLVTDENGRQICARHID